MSNDEARLEAEIQAKRLSAPRLTPDHIDACISPRRSMSSRARPDRLRAHPAQRLHRHRHQCRRKP